MNFHSDQIRKSICLLWRVFIRTRYGSPRSGGQINKNSDIVDWVAKLNALKEKEAALKGNMTEKEAKKEATSAAWKKRNEIGVFSHEVDEIQTFECKDRVNRQISSTCERYTILLHRFVYSLSSSLSLSLDYLRFNCRI